MACIAACLLLWCGVEAWLSQLPSEPEPVPVSALLSALERLPGPVLLVQRHPSETNPIHVDALDSAGWVATGLSPKQAASALRYRTAVGGFSDERVLQRMRVLPDDWMARHRDRLRFPSPVQQPEETKERWPVPGSDRAEGVSPETEGTFPLRPEEPVDLNAADSLTLVRMKGVGPWVAGRILSARRQWGGFAAPSQLREALGWDSLADVLAPRFEASRGDVIRRCPDSLSLTDWRSMPGVEWKEAEVLSRYVALHGAGDSTLQGCLGVRDSVLRQVAMYLRPCGEN